MAAIRKRTWTDRTGEQRQAWLVDYRDGAGKRRSKQFSKKRDADAWLVAAAWSVRQGVHTPDSQAITVAEAAEQWIENAMTRGLERGTVKGMQEVARLHIVPIIGGQRLSRLTMPLVEEFKDILLQTRSRSIAHKAVRSLSSILIEAMRRGHVGQNVARSVSVKISNRDRKKIVPPPAEHLKALLAAADQLGALDPRLPVLLRVAMLTGLRSSELRGLRWSDVDLKAPALSVTQRADRWGTIGSPKSIAGARTIPIGPALVSVLRAWRLRCPGALVFPNRRGNPISQHRIIDLFLAIQIEAGLAINTGNVDAHGEVIWRPQYGLHSLRHAAASAWIKRGIDHKRLQTWLGHASIKTTMDRYGHMLTDAQADATLAAGAEAALLA